MTVLRARDLNTRGLDPCAWSGCPARGTDAQLWSTRPSCLPHKMTDSRDIGNMQMVGRGENDPPSVSLDHGRGTNMTMKGITYGRRAALELLERVEEISPGETGPVSLTDVGRARIAEVFNRHWGRGCILALVWLCTSAGIWYSIWLAACRRNITPRLWMGTRFFGSFRVASRLPPRRCGC